MIHAFLLSAVILQSPALESDAAHPILADFAKPVTPVHDQRLAITPVLDGKIEPEEWDPFAKTDEMQTYFQWEPGVLHGAATLPLGQDLLVSLDLKGDGWLVGRDNLEIRFTWDGGSVTPKIRTLDATHPDGPEWVDAPELLGCLAHKASSDPATWTLEFSLADWGMERVPDERGHRMSLRFDPSSTVETNYAAYLPRLVAPVRLVMSRTTFAPDGLRFKPEFKGRNVSPGQSTRIRFTFNGNDDMGIKRVEMRTEGVAEESTSMMAEPFPSFDKKSRAFVDYNTRIAEDAKGGYRVARATLNRSEGEPIICQTSYRIAPILDFDVVNPKGLVSSEASQKVRMVAYIRSNVPGRVDGVFDVGTPEGWTVDTGVGKSFIIANSRGSVRKVFDVIVPPGARGVFPLRLRAEFGSKDAIEQVAWVTIL